MTWHPRAPNSWSCSRVNHLEQRADGRIALAAVFIHSSCCNTAPQTGLIIVVQLLSRVWLFVTSWTTASQASLSITNFHSLLKLMSTESVMPSNHLILCRPLSSCLQSFPASGSFPMSQFFASSGQSIGASASASVLPMKIQDWFPLRLTVLYVLCWLYCMFSYHQVFFINNQATSQVCAFGYLFIALICIPTL